MKSKLTNQVVIDLELNELEFNTLYLALGNSISSTLKKKAENLNLEILTDYDIMQLLEDLEKLSKKVVDIEVNK